MTTLTDAVMYGAPKTDAEAVAQVRRGLYVLSTFLEMAETQGHHVRAALAVLHNLRGRPDLDDRLTRLQLAIGRCMAEACAIDPRQPADADTAPEVTQ